MIALGIILVGVGALLALGGFWLTSSAGTDALVTFGTGWINTGVSPLVIFMAGGVAVLCIWWGLWALGAGTKRSYRSAKERRAVEREVRAHDRARVEAESRLEVERARYDEADKAAIAADAADRRTESMERPTQS